MRELFLRTLKRRQMTISELCKRTKISKTWANKLRDRLIKEDKIELERRDGRSYTMKLK